MENISKKLLAEVPEMDAAKKYKFQLLSARYDKKLKRLIVPSSRNVLAQDVIFDPNLKKNVDIMCIERKVPMGKGVNGSDIQLKHIDFVRKENGKKVISGKDKGKTNLFQYLYLSNYNAANADKPWHIKPKNGYIYTFVEAEKTAEERLAIKSSIAKAQNLILGLSEKDVSIMCEGLAESTPSKGGFRYDANSSVAQKRDRLFDYATKNFERMLAFDKKFDMEARRMIAAAVESEIIAEDKNKQQVIWCDTGNKLCVVESGKDYITTLVGYFTTKEGKQAAKTIIANLKEPVEKV